MQAFEAGAPVVMYSFSSCPFCLKAKGVLDDLRVPYRVMELAQAAAPDFFHFSLLYDSVHRFVHFLCVDHNYFLRNFRLLSCFYCTSAAFLSNHISLFAHFDTSMCLFIIIFISFYLFIYLIYSTRLFVILQSFLYAFPQAFMFQDVFLQNFAHRPSMLSMFLLPFSFALADFVVAVVEFRCSSPCLAAGCT